LILDLNRKDRVLLDNKFWVVGNPDFAGHDRLGFRNIEDIDNCSILAIGDSWTYGMGLKTLQTWTNLYNNNNNNKIYNCAVGGWGLIEFYEALKKYKIGKNKVVFSIYLGNDIVAAYTHTYKAQNMYTQFLKDKFNVNEALEIPFSTKSKLIFNFQYSESSNINRFDNLNEYSDGNLKFAEWYYGPQKRLLISSQLKVKPNKKWLQKGTITAAFQNIKESRVQRKFTSLNRSYRNEKVAVWSLNGDFFVPLTKENNRILSYGFEGTYNKVNSNAYGKTLSVVGNTIIGFSDDFKVQSRYPDGGSTYASLASYVNYRQDINKKATLNTGIRFVNTYLSAKWIDDTFITLPKFNISLNNSAVTATIGYVYKPTTDWQLNNVISSGFRSPNIDDIGKIREKSGDVTVPNIYLKPEYIYSFETSALKYFNNKTFQIGLDVYYTLLNNYITRDYFSINNSETIMYDGEEGNVVANVNKDNAYIIGSTFSFRGNLNSRWFTRGSVTYTKGKAYDTKLPLSSIPPLFGLFEIGFKKERLQASLNWKFNAEKRLKDYNLIEGKDNIEQTPFIDATNSYFGNPSWNTFNFGANYKVNSDLTCYVNIDNIFDIHYKEFASSISSPGRNFSFSFLLSI